MADERIAGVPLCAKHKEELRDILSGSALPLKENSERTWSRVAKSYRNPPPAPARDAALAQAKEAHATERTQLSPHQSATDPETADLLGCVYYITTRKNAEFVKIGTTRQASVRFKAIMNTSGYKPRLLVAEPGSNPQESARHLQFEHIRTHGEFFRYTDELVNHIASLRQRYPNYRDFTDVGRSYD